MWRVRIKIKKPSVPVQWKCLVSSKTIHQRRYRQQNQNLMKDLWSQSWNLKLDLYRSLCPALVPSRIFRQTYSRLKKFTKSPSSTLDFSILTEMLATFLSKTALMKRLARSWRDLCRLTMEWPFQTRSRSAPMTWYGSPSIRLSNRFLRTLFSIFEN